MRSLFAALVVAALATPAFAADPAPAALVKPPAQSAQPAQLDTVEKDLERVVCKPRQTTGSRLPAAKICRTQREWNLMEIENRRLLEKGQDTRGLFDKK
ncbi:MAG: hypothetical protein JSR45_05530 [Proteobacteria bacterium]|nr:hypothetical protein [Pseudomonadota bacterium]